MHIAAAAAAVRCHFLCNARSAPGRGVEMGVGVNSWLLVLVVMEHMLSLCVLSLV